MGSTSKLCEIADAGPLVHTMSWEEIGKACGDASLRIAELEAALHNALEACRHYRNAGTLGGVALAEHYEANARKAVRK